MYPFKQFMNQPNIKVGLENPQVAGAAQELLEEGKSEMLKVPKQVADKFLADHRAILLPPRKYTIDTTTNQATKRRHNTKVI
jgi:hypothetical protein